VIYADELLELFGILIGVQSYNLGTLVTELSRGTALPGDKAKSTSQNCASAYHLGY